MAYGSSKEGGYGADVPVTSPEQSDRNGGADSVSGRSALGRVHGADGEVSITRPVGNVLRVRAGDQVFHGDVIETGADGFVTIAFADGSRPTRHSRSTKRSAPRPREARRWCACSKASSPSSPDGPLTGALSSTRRSDAFKAARRRSASVVLRSVRSRWVSFTT